MKIENPLVSIAIATYNGETYITDQLNSILAQSYQNLEIVIVDDRSTDQTFQILQNFQKLDHRIRLQQNEHNLGCNVNFNKALCLSTGDYIAISDQDDIWDKDKISYMIEIIGDDLMLYHDSTFVDANGNLKGKKMSDLHRFVKGNCEAFLLYQNCVSGHACLINKALLTYCLPLPQGIYYDWWMAYTAACLGKLNFTKHALVLHRRHSQSTTENDKTDNRRNKRIKNLILFQNHPLTPSVTKALITKLLSGYHGLTEESFSLKFFFLLLVNAKKILYIRRRSLFSMVQFLFRESSKHD